MNPLPAGFQYIFSLPSDGIVNSIEFDPVVEIIGPDHIVYYRFSLTKGEGQSGTDSINTELHCLDIATGDTISDWFANSLTELRSKARLRRVIRFSPTSDLAYMFDNHVLYNAFGTRRSGNTAKNIDGKPIKVSRLCCQFLDTVLSAEGRTVSIEELSYAVYGPKEMDPGAIYTLYKRLTEYDPLLHDLIKSDRNKGYQYIGLWPAWYIGEVDDSFLKYFPEKKAYQEPHIHSGCYARLCSGKYYVDRPEIIQSIRDAFDAGTTKTFVFLSGIGGIGKSELARAFARVSISSGMFTTAIPLVYSHVDSAFFKAVNESPDFVDTGLVDSGPSSVALKEKLLFTAEKDVLLIIDDYDIYDPAFLMDLFNRTGDAAILITTRLGATSEIQDFGDVITIGIDDAQKDFSKNVFCRYARISEARNAQIDSIVNAIGYHTLLASLLGRQIVKRRAFVSSSDAIRQLAEQLSSITWHYQLQTTSSVIKDGSLFTDSDYYEILKKIFSDVIQYEYSDIHRQILGASLFIGQVYLSPPQVLTALLGANPYSPDSKIITDAFSDLLDSGLVTINESQTIYVHPLIAKLLLDKHIRPDGKQIAVTTSPFRLHTLKNKLINNYSLLSNKSTLNDPERLESLLLSIPHLVKQVYWERVPSEEYGWKLWELLQCSATAEIDRTIDVDRLVKSIYWNHAGYYSEEEIKDVLLHTVCGSKCIHVSHECLEPGTGLPYVLFVASGKYGKCLLLADYYYKGLTLCIANGSLGLSKGHNLYCEGNLPDNTVGSLEKASVFRVSWDNPPENAKDYAVYLDLRDEVKYHFGSKENAREVACPITKIGLYASFGFPTDFGEIKFGDKTEDIGAFAFQYVTPSFVEIPESVRVIHCSAFQGASRARIPNGLLLDNTARRPPLVVGKDLVSDSKGHLVYAEDYFLEDRYNTGEDSNASEVSPPVLSRFPYLFMPFSQECVVEIYDKELDISLTDFQDKTQKDVEKTDILHNR